MKKIFRMTIAVAVLLGLGVLSGCSHVESDPVAINLEGGLADYFTMNDARIDTPKISKKEARKIAAESTGAKEYTLVFNLVRKDNEMTDTAKVMAVDSTHTGAYVAAFKLDSAKNPSASIDTAVTVIKAESLLKVLQAAKNKGQILSVSTTFKAAQGIDWENANVSIAPAE